MFRDNVTRHVSGKINEILKNSKSYRKRISEIKRHNNILLTEY